jgi:hypothetical protein
MTYYTIIGLLNHANSELRLAVCNEEVNFWGNRVNTYTTMLLEHLERMKNA